MKYLSSCPVPAKSGGDCWHDPHPASSWGLCAEHWRAVVNEWDAEQPSVRIRCARCGFRSDIDSADLPHARCEQCASPIGDLEAVLSILDADGSAEARERKAQGVVYYLRFGNRLKIGFTSEIRARVAGLPCDEVMAAEPGTYATESERLRQFGEYLAWGREWFEMSAPLMEHVSAVREQYGDPFMVGR